MRDVLPLARLEKKNSEQADGMAADNLPERRNADLFGACVFVSESDGKRGPL